MSDNDLHTYLVTWTIEVDATNATDAARKALEIQRDPDSTATVFTAVLRVSSIG